MNPDACFPPRHFRSENLPTFCAKIRQTAVSAWKAFTTIGKAGEAVPKCGPYTIHFFPRYCLFRFSTPAASGNGAQYRQMLNKIQTSVSVGEYQSFKPSAPATEALIEMLKILCQIVGFDGVGVVAQRKKT
jgi:hypothetical protein